MNSYVHRRLGQPILAGRPNPILKSVRILCKSTMHAIRVRQFGGPEVLKLEANVPIPQPQDNQILVKVEAAGINPVDVLIRSGEFSVRPVLPYTPGLDSAGVVEKVGKAVTHFKPGDRVYGVDSVTGAYAGYALLQDPHVAHLPDSITYKQGAGIGVAYYTAYRALITKGKGRPSETVLVHGASGGVGVAACQIAQALGFRVLGTAGTSEGLELVRKNGAHAAFNHKEKGYVDKIKEATNGNGPDIILEMLANVNLETDLNLINNNGRIVIIGSRGTIEVTPALALMKETAVIGVGILTAPPGDWKEMHGCMRAGMEQGWLHPQIEKTFKLTDASEAHREIMKPSGHTGKLILIP